MCVVGLVGRSIVPTARRPAGRAAPALLTHAAVGARVLHKNKLTTVRFIAGLNASLVELRLPSKWTSARNRVDASMAVPSRRQTGPTDCRVAAKFLDIIKSKVGT